MAWPLSARNRCVYPSDAVPRSLVNKAFLPERDTGGAGVFHLQSHSSFSPQWSFPCHSPARRKIGSLCEHRLPASPPHAQHSLRLFGRFCTFIGHRKRTMSYRRESPHLSAGYASLPYSSALLDSFLSFSILCWPVPCLLSLLLFLSNVCVAFFPYDVDAELLHIADEHT